jgi:broad specificity phosphatase PhoE
MSYPDLPKHLWIVRHGQSAGNVARDTAEAEGAELIDLSTRDADTPLSALGHQQAECLAAWFARMPRHTQPTVLMTSPFIRSQQTTLAVADALNFPRADVHVDERLREKEFGILDRYTRVGIKARFPELDAQRALVGKFYFRPPGGESWADVILRLRSVSADLRREHAGQRVLVVAHQVIVNCFRYLLEALTEENILAIDRQGDVPNCAITSYGAQENGARSCLSLLEANQVLPLERSGIPVTTSADIPTGPK